MTQVAVSLTDGGGSTTRGPELNDVMSITEDNAMSVDWIRNKQTQVTTKNTIANYRDRINEIYLTINDIDIGLKEVFITNQNCEDEINTAIILLSRVSYILEKLYMHPIASLIDKYNDRIEECRVAHYKKEITQKVSNYNSRYDYDLEAAVQRWFDNNQKDPNETPAQYSSRGLEAAKAEINRYYPSGKLPDTYQTARTLDELANSSVVQRLANLNMRVDIQKRPDDCRNQTAHYDAAHYYTDELY